MARRRHTFAWMIGAGVLALFLGCEGVVNDPPVTTPTPEPPHGLIVSDPVTSIGVAEAGALGAPMNRAGDDVAYVSLTPGTAATGASAIIRRVGDANLVIMPMFDGGFDPIPVVAQAGDSIEVVVLDTIGSAVQTLGVTVEVARRPIVIRTEPPRRKTDVPINVPIVVVFSEPVAGGTVTPASIQLFRGTSSVTGTVSVLTGTGAVAAFVPAAPLAENTEYRLEVTQGVRDLDDEALLVGETVTFTTGQSSTGLPWSIQTSPDSVLSLVVGETYQVTATVRDTLGNVLLDEPVTWSEDNCPLPDALTVSSTGLVTAIGDGFCTVKASVGALSDRLHVFVSPQPAASVDVAPSPATVAQGDTIHLAATVRDAQGRVINNPSVAWTSSNQAVATVVPSGSTAKTGIVTGVSPDGVTITATSGSASGTAAVTVVPGVPVASVTVTPDISTFVAQATVQLTTTLRDANGQVITGRLVTWASDDDGVVTVDATGLVTGVSQGSAGVTATSEGLSDTAAFTVTVISFGSVIDGGLGATCALTTSGAAYCWGGTPAPFAVAGGLTFATVTAAIYHGCGVTTGGTAYCWGSNSYGQLGDGSTNSSSVPVPVAGGLSFSTVSAGYYHTCGVTTSGAAYCWGRGNPAPVAIPGGLSYSTVSTGGDHSCGITTSGAAYCWGENSFGQLGNGSTTSSSVPLPVAGELTFSVISIGDGGGHTCGVTTNGAAYCWGYNGNGQLGTGSTTSASVPALVTGGFNFSSVNAGSLHTCGVTFVGEAYCWGDNRIGQLGDGSHDDYLEPVAVTGGHTFRTVTAGGGLEGWTCGLTTGGVAYCWGMNLYGQLGNGSSGPSAHSDVPVKVAGQP